jgi:hypothetical protein
MRTQIIPKGLLCILKAGRGKEKGGKQMTLNS